MKSARNIKTCTDPSSQSFLGFCLVLFSLQTAFAVETVSNAQSIYQVGTLNGLAFQSFDVSVASWNASMPEVNNLAATNTEFHTDFRLIIDFERQKCLYVSHRVAQKEKPSEKGKVSGTDWAFEFYDAATRVKRYLDNPSRGDVRSSVSFEEFCKLAKVPWPQFSGVWTDADGSSKITLSEQVRRTVESHKSSEIRFLPDGTQQLVTKFTTEYPMTTTIFVSPKTLMPFQFTCVEDRNGKPELYYKHQVEYEEVEQLYRPIRIVFDRALKTAIPGTRIPVPTTVIGTTDLTWHHVNTNQLAFPDVAKLGFDVKEWNKFLTVEEPTK